MAPEKKARNPNFMEAEENVLFSLVAKYKAIIENKKTDAVTGREKEKAWQEILSKFNAQCGSCFRNAETLKKFYSNKKAIVRKRAAQHTTEMFRTGGGKPVNILKENDDLLLTL